MLPGTKAPTPVIRIFPDWKICLRLIRVLAGEIHEAWLGTHRYLNMEALKEQKKTPLSSLELTAT